jgi:hypothetical protein
VALAHAQGLAPVAPELSADRIRLQTRKCATGAAMPAMKIATMLAACAMALAACDRDQVASFMPKVADQAASLMPKTFRPSDPQPPPAEPELDVKELIRANADTLFTAAPTALAVARPKRITGRGFSVCVNAVVAGALNTRPQPITLIVIIERGKLADRRRATPEDGCAHETYEKVEVTRPNAAKPQQ